MVKAQKAAPTSSTIDIRDARRKNSPTMNQAQLSVKDEADIICRRLVVISLIMCFGVIMGFAIIQGIRFGFGHRDYLFLACGSVFSILCCMAYSHVGKSLVKGSPTRAWMRLAIVFGGPLPYLLIAYIVFYRGVWALIRLFSEFSVASLCSGLAFLLVGTILIRQFAILTDIVRDQVKKAREMGALR